jgi:hypothetical protein
MFGRMCGVANKIGSWYNEIERCGYDVVAELVYIP